MAEICVTPTKPLPSRAFRLDGLITPTLKAAGSNPVGRTNQSSRNTCVSGVFSCPKTGFSLIFSLIGSTGGNCADKTLHAVGTFALHLVSHMAVYVQRKSRCGVAQVPLHRLDVVPDSNRGNGVGVPLRYNYDKPEKPRISRVFGYLARFFILFQTEKSSREVVIS